ncbi:MAG: methyltransferase domain-containing protein [Alphaproteobacteria bacterium]
MAEEYPRCFLAKPGPPVEEWRAAGQLLSLPEERKVLRCGDVAWLYPMPTFEECKALYSEAYYSCRDSACPLSRIESRQLDYFGRRVRRISERLGRTPESLLDIGAASGLFVRAAQEQGIQAEGIELSSWACEKAKAEHGIDLLEGDLVRDDLSLRPHYDVVVMNHVLEHLVEPLAYLERIHDLLAPDGLLAIEIPQQFINPIDLLYRAAQHQRPYSLASIHHPYFYTVSSVLRLMEMSGFKVEHLVTWLPEQVFHLYSPIVTHPLQAMLWFANRIALRGHVIEIFATPDPEV